MFAATPPLEAKRLLFAAAVTEGVGYRKGSREQGMKVDFIDIERAYFHADAQRKVYVELPEEDRQEGMCGEMLKSMYGTRDAARNWENEYAKFMDGIGMKRGSISACTFMNKDAFMSPSVFL